MKVEGGFCNNSEKVRGRTGTSGGMWPDRYAKRKVRYTADSYHNQHRTSHVNENCIHSFVIFLALWLLRSKKCVIFMPNYVFA